MSVSGLIVRKVVRDDVECLLSLLIESNPSLKITHASLESDLACGNELEFNDAQQAFEKQTDVNNNVALLELDPKLVKSNVPAVLGFLAEFRCDIEYDSHQPVGVLLFHYHYSPWTGHTAFINTIYVRPEHRNKGIATLLLDELRLLCSQQGISRFLYETSQIPRDLVEQIAAYGMRVYRNDDSDWCVFKINFE